MTCSHGQFVRHGAGGVWRTAGDDDGAPPLCQCNAHGPADAPRATRDECYHASQRHAGREAWEGGRGSGARCEVLNQCTMPTPPAWAGWAVATLAVSLLASRLQWSTGVWLFRQLEPLPDVLLSSPIPEGHEDDINFWTGQVLAVVAICLAMYIWFTSTNVVEKHVLPYLFRTEAQKAVFRFFFLQHVKDVVFMFASQQVRRCAPMLLPAVPASVWLWRWPVGWPPCAPRGRW